MFARLTTSAPHGTNTVVDGQRLYRQVGARIKSRRKHLGWTQERLAQHVGLSRASLANIEIGRQNVLLHRLYRIAGTLNVEVADLLPSLSEPTGNLSYDLPLPPDLSARQRAQIAHILQDDVPILSPELP